MKKGYQALTTVYDVIIIGSGVIGTSIGHHLSRRGWRTVNIDSLSASGQGSTSSSLAIIRTHYSTLQGTSLAWEGYHYWSNWSNHVNLTSNTPLANFIETGVFVLKTSDNNWLTKQIMISKELKIPFDEWSSQKVGEKFTNWDVSSFGPPISSNDPAFGQPTAPSIHGGIFFPNAGYCDDPRLATQNLQKAAEIAGGTFVFNCKVDQIKTQTGRVSGVILSDGRMIDAPVIVNAAGPHSHKINALITDLEPTQITTRALRHESINLPVSKEFVYQYDGVITFDNDIGSYTRPDQEKSIFVGSQGTPFDNNEAIDPDDFDRNFTDTATEPLYRLAQRVPSLGIPNQIRGIVDLWDVTEDWIPVYDCSSMPGYYLAIGTSGNQFKTAPVVGALMAELITACENGHNHDAEPVDFFMEKTGNRIKLDFFSRNREVDTRSSFSVLA